MKLSVIFEYIDKATAPLARTGRQFDGLGKAIKNASNCMIGLNQSAEFMQRMGDTMNGMMQPGVQFQQSMADLSSITGIAGDDLDRLGKIARETGKSSGLGASGAADAFALLASQIDVSKIGMDGLVELQSKTITLAQASGMSMADAANSMAGTINQFGMQAGEAGRVINVLAAGSKYGAAEIPQLAESFKVVGAAANAAGLSVESTAGAIEVLSKNNLKGSEAGTALRNIMLKMQTELKVDFSKTSLSDALDALKPKIKDVTYLSKTFGMENIAAAQFLIKNSEAVQEMTDRVTDTSVATEQAAIRTDTWAQKIKVQTAQFNDWAIGLQQNFGGVMYAFQMLGQGSSMLLTLAPIGKMFFGIGQAAWGAGLGIVRFGRTLKMLAIAKQTGAAFGFARAVASCGTMGRVAAAGLAIWSKVTKIAGLVQGGFMTALKGMKMMMMTSVIPSFVAAITATWAWTAALLANPLTWIAAGIAALVAAVVVCWQKFAGFRAVMLTTWDAVKGFGMAIFNYLVTPLKVVWKIFSGLGKALVKLFTGDFKGAAAEFTGAFKDGFQEGVDGFKKSINGVVDTVSGISGNYEMHLTDETAKQAAKEKEKAAEKEKKQQQKPGGEIESFLPEFNMNVPEINVPEANINVPEMENIPAVNPVFNAPTPVVKTAAANVVPPVVNVPGQPGINVPETKAVPPVYPVFNAPTPVLTPAAANVAPPVVNVPKQPGINVPEAKAVPPVYPVFNAPAPVLTPAAANVAPPIVNVPKQPGISVPEAKAVPPVVNVRMPEFPILKPLIFRDSIESRPENKYPEIKSKSGNTTAAAIPRLENQVSNITNSLMNDNRQTNTSTNTTNNQTGAKVEIKFQPVVNISADLTQKTKDDLLKALRGMGEEITKMVEEVQRKNGRGTYAIS